MMIVILILMCTYTAAIADSMSYVINIKFNKSQQ